METLFAIGMIVGLMRSHAEPPKAAAPVAPRQMAQQQLPDAEKARPRKKSDWPLDY